MITISLKELRRLCNKFDTDEGEYVEDKWQGKSLYKHFIRTLQSERKKGTCVMKIKLVRKDGFSREFTVELSEILTESCLPDIVNHNFVDYVFEAAHNDGTKVYYEATCLSFIKKDQEKPKGDYVIV